MRSPSMSTGDRMRLSAYCTRIHAPSTHPTRGLLCSALLWYWVRTGRGSPRPVRTQYASSTKMDPFWTPKSTQERPKSLLGALFERLWAAKSLEDASSSDLRSTCSVAKACRSDYRGDLGRSWLARAARWFAPVRARSSTPQSPFANSGMDITILLIYIHIYILLYYCTTIHFFIQ